MFEGGLNVPFIVAGPLVNTPGESAALVHGVDIFATAAEIAGVDLASVVDDAGVVIPIDGQSLLPYLADPSTPGRTYLYAEQFEPLGFGPYKLDQRAVRDARFKLVIDGLTGSEKLFDLQGRFDDGPDLITAGPLDPVAAAALVGLEAAMADFGTQLVHATQ